MLFSVRFRSSPFHLFLAMANNQALSHFRAESVLRSYSDRTATIGSTRVARRAGA